MISVALESQLRLQKGSLFNWAGIFSLFYLFLKFSYILYCIFIYLFYFLIYHPVETLTWYRSESVCCSVLDVWWNHIWCYDVANDADSNLWALFKFLPCSVRLYNVYDIFLNYFYIFYDITKNVKIIKKNIINIIKTYRTW